ncbi:hypothetical protein NHX12_026080 [Muraenolepis orangiensis]|uniref:Uncharacterized protein n=1 Tax=Muraenolepis orangiensis TaxID=630683 RepID=A0A9Q0EFW8_9TELE|nr:hypothetical protein NHX12_026080 [Muraenolepis orangiensis]
MDQDLGPGPGTRSCMDQDMHGPGPCMDQDMHGPGPGTRSLHGPGHAWTRTLHGPGHAWTRTWDQVPAALKQQRGSLSKQRPDERSTNRLLQVGAVHKQTPFSHND